MYEKLTEPIGKQAYAVQYPALGLLLPNVTSDGWFGGTRTKGHSGGSIRFYCAGSRDPLSSLCILLVAYRLRMEISMRHSFRVYMTCFVLSSRKTPSPVRRRDAGEEESRQQHVTDVMVRLTSHWRLCRPAINVLRQLELADTSCRCIEIAIFF